MKIIMVVAIIILTVSTLAGIERFINKSIKFPIKTKALPIDDHFAQEIVNGISSGLVPRIVLAKICGEYLLENTRIACLSGTSITQALKIDLLNDLGVSEMELLSILDDTELYPDEQLEAIANRLGFGEQFNQVIESN